MKTIPETKSDFNISSLSERKRASLAHALIQILDDNVDINVDKSWDNEVQKRIRKFKCGESKVHPAFDVLDRIKNKL